MTPRNFGGQGIKGFSRLRGEEVVSVLLFVVLLIIEYGSFYC